MFKILSAIAVALMVSLSSYTPADAGQRGYYQVRDHGGGYRNRHRHRGYGHRHRHRGYGYRRHRRDWVGPAILGFGLGMGGAIIINNQNHHNWCLSRYRSYNPATGMYLGYDGYYRVCRSPYR